MVADEEPHILQTDLSSYEVYRRVAGGGFGSVHFGRDLGSNKPVAIKRLHSHLAYEPALVRRFEQEAQRLRGLQHINIVQVLDQGTDRGNVPFIILEWVDGWTLSSLLERRGRLPAEEVVEIAYQALAALEVANQHGIVHRDIKPSNLMLTAPPERIVKVMDFGIAKDTLAEAPGRQSHTQIGTLAYMAPEQFLGESIDTRTDLYALGVTLYELLTGSHPYRDALDTELRPLMRVDPEIDPHLAEVVHRALSRAPGQRFKTPTDMRSALEPFRQPAIRLSVPPHTRPQAGLWAGQASAAPPAQSASHSTAGESESEVARLEAHPVAATAGPRRWRFRSLVALACLGGMLLTATAAGALAFGHVDAGVEQTPSSVNLTEAEGSAILLPLSAANGVPTVQPTPVTPGQSTALPTVLSISTPVAASTPAVNAADAWQATLMRLDTVWQTDWPMSIQILDSYLQQYPDQQSATDKLYAALVGYSGELVESGSTAEGIAQLERAQALAPGRQEAQNALRALIPTTAALPTRPPSRIPTSTPIRIASSAPAATPIRDSSHATALPSPTPFRSPTPVPATGATQEGGVLAPPTPIKSVTSPPTMVATRVTGGVTVVPTATRVRNATPTPVTKPTRVISSGTATTGAAP